MGFMLVFLRALLREPKKRTPFYALLLQLSRPAEPERRRAAAAGRRH